MTVPQKMNARMVAKMYHISHTKLYEARRIHIIAESRGVDEEYEARIAGGEKQTSVLNDLLPDFASNKKASQQRNQFRSTSKWLLANGFELDDLIYYLCECAGRGDLSEHLSIYLQEPKG